jgi:hypothetical protein
MLTECKIINAGYEGNWTWSHSKETLTDSSWAANFPNAYYSNTDDCGLMVVEPTQSYWKDTTCCSPTVVDQQKVAPICQHYRACPSGWKTFEGRCYLMAASRLSWPDAENDCNSKRGHLASVHSAAEDTFIRSLDSTDGLWIGGSDASVEVGFTIYVHTLQIQVRAIVKSRFCARHIES